MTTFASPRPPAPHRALKAAAIPLLAALAVNGFLAVSGWSEPDPNYEAVPLLPPGWVVGLIWCVIYPLWGLAYAEVTAHTQRRHADAWLFALMGWGLCYPLLSPFWDTAGSALANLFSLALALVATWQSSKVSKRTVAYMAPSLAWISFASYIGYLAWRNSL